VSVSTGINNLALITISLLPSSQASRYTDHSLPHIIMRTFLRADTAVV